MIKLIGITRTKYIPEYDRNGVHLKEGDIVADCKVGDLIWDGSAQVIKRPLGVITLLQPMPDQLGVEVADCYNILPIRAGIVKILNKEHLKHLQPFTDDDCCTLYMSKIEADYYNWGNIEVIGTVNDFV
jgi:hypothetical protein